MTRAKILPGTESRVIPRQFSHEVRSPFPFYSERVELGPYANDMFMKQVEMDKTEVLINQFVRQFVCLFVTELDTH